jgi:hypothetical protein
MNKNSIIGFFDSCKLASEVFKKVVPLTRDVTEAINVGDLRRSRFVWFDEIWIHN